MLKLLVVDDHPIFRKGLVALILSSKNECEITEADDGEKVIEALKKSNFDITILDIDMPEKSGIDVLNYIALNEINTKSVILTMHNDELFFNEAFNRGAKGFVLKEDSGHEIIDCINEIEKGKVFVSSKLKSFLLNRTTFNREMKKFNEAISSLTKSEYNTIKLVAENKTSKEIAEKLFVTEKSIENYRGRICKKLGISGGSNSLYKWCIENKDKIKRIFIFK